MVVVEEVKKKGVHMVEEMKEKGVHMVEEVKEKEVIVEEVKVMGEVVIVEVPFEAGIEFEDVDIGEGRFCFSERFADIMSFSAAVFLLAVGWGWVKGWV